MVTKCNRHISMKRMRVGLAFVCCVLFSCFCEYSFSQQDMPKQSNEAYLYVCLARSEYHTQLAKMSFDEIFDLTAGVYFNFYNICTCVSTFVCFFSKRKKSRQNEGDSTFERSHPPSLRGDGSPGCDSFATTDRWRLCTAIAFTDLFWYLLYL